jgi:hypothetical protein
MALVAFDSDDKLHHDLFDNFKADLISDIYSKDHLYCQCNDYTDEMNIVLRELAVHELGLDSDIAEFDSYWVAAIADKNPKTFTIIVGIEYVDIETDKDEVEFLTVEGEIMIEDEKLILFNADSTTLNYSSHQEFDKARRSYSP